MKHAIILCTAALALGACTQVSAPSMARLTEPDLTSAIALGPPNARPGACYGRTATPAETRQVRGLVMVQPAQVRLDGTVLAPPIYREELRTETVREREELWFEIPCELEANAPFIANLQRALAARNLYSGPINGLYDPRTRKAVRSYQHPQGLDSGILSLAAARKLGLAAIPRPTHGAG